MVGLSLCPSIADQLKLADSQCRQYVIEGQELALHGLIGSHFIRWASMTRILSRKTQGIPMLSFEQARHFLLCLFLIKNGCRWQLKHMWVTCVHSGLANSKANKKFELPG